MRLASLGTGATSTRTHWSRNSSTCQKCGGSLKGERAKRAILDEENSSDGSREIASAATSTTKLTLFHSILFTRLIRFALASLKRRSRQLPKFVRKQTAVRTEQNNSKKKKLDNRYKHTREGAVQYKSEREKSIIKEIK